MADAIFISYRRDDSEGEAGRLFDDLTRAFGSEAVFMDVAGIKPGVDFRRAIEQNVSSCGVLLAIIGPEWINIAHPDGTRRLDDPNDFVAIEIASAMKREVPVIPVLVHDAKMPAAALLPANLKDLAFRNSVEISHARWNSDVSLLIDALKSYVTPAAAADGQTVHATVPVQLPAPHPPDRSAPSEKPSNAGLYAGLAIAAVVILCLVTWQVLLRSHHGPSRAIAPAGQAPTEAALSANVASDAGPDPDAPNADLKSAMVGTWKRIGKPTDKANIVELEISPRGKRLTIQATEAGGDGWPQQPGRMKGGALHATFIFPGYPNTYDLKIAAVGAAQLSVTETATSPDGAHSESDKFLCERQSLLGSQ